MPIPAELRRTPPVRALEWAAEQVGPEARVRRVRRLRNSWAAAMHALDVDDGGGVRHRLVLRRWVRTDLRPDEGVVDNERIALMALESTAVASPRFVAADAAGERADAPALLMTRLPGRGVLAPHDVTAYVSQLADALRAIHATTVPAALRDYRPWSLDVVTTPPPWSARADVWRRAIEIANGPVPAYDPVLVHRDFHPGNVLWTRGRLSGVVDWTHACRGPAAADVAHCRLNLALLFGFDAADAFSECYGALDAGALAWHDIADAVSVGGERPLDAWRWHDAGRTDVTTQQLTERLDEFFARAVSRVS